MIQILFNRGAKALTVGNYKKAAEIFAELVQDQPDHYEAWNNLGVAYYQQWTVSRNMQTLGKAQKAFEESISINPIFSDALNNLGNLLDDLGDLNGAEIILREAVDADPDHTDALSNLGMVLHRQNKLPEAIKYYKSAIESDPTQASPWCNLGEAFRELGQLDDAFKATRRALEIQPSHPQARNNLMRLLAMSQQNKDSKRKAS